MTSRESDHQPVYHQAALFSGEQPAGRAYNQLQDAIFRSPECDLSVYRLLLRRDWLVTVIGIPPAETLDWRIRQILSRGVPMMLPEEIVAALQQRRAEATRLGPWVERHQRPIPPHE